MLRATGWLLLALLCLTLGACFEPVKDTHPNQVLTKRRALFRQFTRTLEPMGLVASGRRDFQREDFLASAQDLEKLADKPWVYFPADGNYPPTHARPSVWSQPAEFLQAQKNFQAAVHQLVLTAQTGNVDQVAAAYQKMSDSCNSCHHNFRYN